jgi:hypothetical protein
VNRSEQITMTQSTVLPISDEFRRPIRVALCQQIPFAIVCLLMLDGGGAAKLCGVVMLGFWSACAIIVARRPTSPTTLDKILIKYSFLPLFAAAGLFAQFIHR